MAGSYEDINYSLRPAKAVERKMLCEAFRCLGAFRSLESYRYIGFGSTYFSDFQLFHRTLGLRDMISIEKDEPKRSRFEFNKPFDCIRMEFRPSNTALPTLVMQDLPAIIWLDYDDPLNADILADIQTVTTLAAPSTMLVVSVNVQPVHLREAITDENPAPTRRDLLKAKIGDNLPDDVLEKDLGGWQNATVIRRIITNKINETLERRNAARQATQHLRFEQTFNFHYADGAKMLTVGGVFFDPGLALRLEGSGIRQLPFYRNGAEPYRIDIPNLTYREIHFLQSKLPSGVIGEQNYSIPAGDISRYSALYRYFPAFSEVVQ